MKKRKITFKILIVFIILIGGILWYEKPTSPFDFDSEHVEEISIIDGSTGILSTITKKEDIIYIINHLNTIKLKRKDNYIRIKWFKEIDQEYIII